MNKLKHYWQHHKPFILGVCSILSIIAVWQLGVAFGVSSLISSLVGTGLVGAGFGVWRLLGNVANGLAPDPSADDVTSAVPDAKADDSEALTRIQEGLLSNLQRVRMRGTDSRRSDEAYRLPWYVLLGASGSGKSTLLHQSGLDFPYAEHDDAGAAALAPTADCEWLFSSDAVFLDTAGRYVTQPEYAGQWRGVLRLLRVHLPRRPLNGLIVTVSIAQLLEAEPQARERLAKQLRERIQEAHELLELRLPIYLLFTQCDRLPGFTDFYQRLDASQRGEVMGKSFSHQDYQASDWGQRFAAGMDEVIGHWQQVGDQQVREQDIMATRQDSAAYRLPLELAALKPLLEDFIGAMLRANPYQGAELLRGFYFTSAEQAEAPLPGAHARQVIERFQLESRPNKARAGQSMPLFIQGLLQKVVIADQHVVTLYSGNRREHRHRVRWVSAAVVTGLLLWGGWGWSYVNNSAAITTMGEQLTEAGRRDQLSDGQFAPWHRLDTLRFWAADYYARHHGEGVPLPLRMGLYQGHVIEPFLRRGYFAQLETAMLKPVADNLTRSLQVLPTIKVYPRTTRELAPVVGIDSVATRAVPVDNRALSLAGFGRAALDTYVMLSRSQRDKADTAFLKEKLPDYWYPAIARQAARQDLLNRELPEAEDYLYAGRQVDFYSEQIHEADVPRISDNAFLIANSRSYINSLLAQTLRSVETITLESDTLFAFGRADFQSLKEAGQRQLSAIAGKLLNMPNLGKIVIAGHADQLGDAQSNVQVSRQRAQTIKTYLVGKGLPEELVDAVGEGSAKPLVRCDTPMSRADLISCLEPNRRVEIEVRALN